MRKTIIFWAFAAAVLLIPSARSADSTASEKPAAVPLTPGLANEIQKNPYVDESVQTTTGNIVGIFTQAISDESGKPILGVIQAYDNVTRAKDFIAVPWPMLRFHQQDRRIEFVGAAAQLRDAPKFKREQIPNLRNNQEAAKIYQHFGVAIGGGAVAASMGTQSGQGASLPTKLPTNEAQPHRGSVGAIYVFGAIAVLAFVLFFLRRRT